MARIRNIKPDFFRHEVLQDLEAEHPGSYIMLTYVALWTHCDASGIFPWKPRTLKLDILPFIEYDLSNTLRLLQEAGFIEKYLANDDGKEYGYIPTFVRHQRITGKEATEGKKYPPPSDTQQGNNRETTGKQQDAQGEEEERITGRGRESNARAHEAENFQDKKSADDNQAPTAFNALHEKMLQWVETDQGHAALMSWKAAAGYSDRIHGPTTSELVKFISYYLGKSSQRDRLTENPVQFFAEQFPQWLTRATEYNKKKPSDTGPPIRRYQQGPERPHARTGPTTLSAVVHHSK